VVALLGNLQLRADSTTANTALKLAGRGLSKQADSKMLSIHDVESMTFCQVVDAPTSIRLSQSVTKSYGHLECGDVIRNHTQKKRRIVRRKPKDLLRKLFMSTDLKIIYDEWNNDDNKFVKGKLKSYNLQFTSSIPFSVSKPVNLILREDNLINGGLLGYLYWKCCSIDILWIDESCRNKGLGTKLMRKIEEIACENNCNLIHVDTMSFQALEFYKKLGYCVFGELSGYPNEFVRYYLKKELI